MEELQILLIDDDAGLLRSLSKFLELRGLGTQAASNGDEGLAILETGKVDVVVSDVKMPGMSGLELLPLIKKKWPDVEVILLTGQANTTDGVEGMRRGAFDYMGKPVEPEHLLNKIVQASERQARRREKRAQDAFRAEVEARMMAAERLASLGTMAAGVAHEINNPLAIINQSVEWMRAILNGPAMNDIPRKKDLELGLLKIKQGVERARTITHQLLGMVRDNGAAMIPIRVSDLVEEAVSLLHREAMDKGVRVIIDQARDQHTVFTDPGKLRQVLINLLANAIWASPPDGLVEIKVTSDDAEARIEVEDNGPGIPPENLNRIFEPFFTTKPPNHGTGLGLFVTRTILEKLGGQITLNSRLGQGTSFLVWLPANGPNGKGDNHADRSDQNHGG